jgi:hypothetical protein
MISQYNFFIKIKMLSLYEKPKLIRGGQNVQQQQKSSLALHPHLNGSEEGEGRRRRMRRKKKKKKARISKR